MGLPEVVPLLVALQLNWAMLIILIILLSFVAYSAYYSKQHSFKPILTELVAVRRQIKRNTFSLDEFLRICGYLNIDREQVTEMYNLMHSDRRKVGEAWLFDSTGSGDGSDRRKMLIFKSFADTSQFTQGRLGYRMHHLLHRPLDYQPKSAWESLTMFDITRMTKTLKDEPSQRGNA